MHVNTHYSSTTNCLTVHSSLTLLRNTHMCVVCIWCSPNTNVIALNLHLQQLHFCTSFFLFYFILLYFLCKVVFIYCYTRFYCSKLDYSLPCTSLWTKASAKWLKCKCKCDSLSNHADLAQWWWPCQAEEAESVTAQACRGRPSPGSGPRDGDRGVVQSEEIKTKCHNNRYLRVICVQPSQMSRNQG